MPITFACDCGKQLRVADEYAGKRAKCPACGEVAAVPRPESADADDAPRKPALARRGADREDDAGDRPRTKSARRPDEDDDDDDRPRGRSRRHKGEDDDEEDRPRRRRRDDADDDAPPRKKRLTDDGSAKGRRLKADEVEQKPRSLEGKVANGGVLGGIAAMVIAVIWCVAGLVFLERFFIYTPILFVLGLVGFIKGLVSAGEE